MLFKPLEVKSIFKYINPLFTIFYFSPSLPLLNTPNLAKLASLGTKDYKP